MSREKTKPQVSRRCYVCGNLVGGETGVDYHMVSSGKDTRYYCQKCAEKRMRGE